MTTPIYCLSKYTPLYSDKEVKKNPEKGLQNFRLYVAHKVYQHFLPATDVIEVRSLEPLDITLKDTPEVRGVYAWLLNQTADQLKALKR